MINDSKFYKKIFEDTLGLSISMDNINNIKVVNLPNVISKIYPESINNLIKPLENLINDSYNKDINLEPIFKKKILITKYIFNLIDPNADYTYLDEFVEKLQILSNKTYELDSCTMGFIIFKNKQDDIKEELNKLKIDYIPFHKSIQIEELNKIKSSLKIVDSLSICYIIDSTYRVIGLGKKRKSKQSISSIMSNRYKKENEALLKLNMYKYFINNFSSDIATRSTINEIDESIEYLNNRGNEIEVQINKIRKTMREVDTALRSQLLNLQNELKQISTKITNLINKQIELLESEVWDDGLEKFLSEKVNKTNQNIQYVQLNSNKIEWFINDSLVCSLFNGKWNLRNYELISHLILEFMLRQHIGMEMITNETFKSILEKIIPRFQLLFNNIKELSKKNIGSLIILLEKTKSHKPTIYKKMLNKGELDLNEFKSIIRTENNTPVNIFSCDNYLFELICSVDGAVILDRNFNIISFGEMINNSLETPPVAEAGSRTLAAAKASLFGLSIKVSEDGDISIFEKGSPIIKL